MQRERPRYLFHALQGFAVFGALSVLWRGPMLWPSLATPVGWKGVLLDALENGIFGALLVSAVAVIHYRVVVPRPSKVQSRKFLVTGIILIALAFAWFISALNLAGQWFSNPTIADQLIIWPSLILTIFGGVFAGRPLTGWLRRSAGRKP